MKTEQEIQQMISNVEYLMEIENNGLLNDYEDYLTLGAIRDTLKYILILDVSESAFTFLNILETGVKKNAN